jgi:hypothetical protein
MKVDRRIAIVATLVVAASLTQCKSSTTAPYDSRKYSVAATPITVPAVPTVPMSISTNDPNSHVQVTLPVAALQAIVQAAGGPATVNMTDVAPPDFSTLPSGQGALIGPRPLTVLQFNITKSSAAASSAVSPARASTISAASVSTPTPITFTIGISSGTTCNLTPVLYLLQTGQNVFTAVDATNFTLNVGPPETLTGTTTQLAFNQLYSVLDFECPSAKVTVSGASGGNGN